MNETTPPSSLATCTLIQDLLGVIDGGIYEAVVQLKQQLEAREREVMALVAENSALKKSEIEFNEYCRSECENEGSEWVDDFTETPATSAALAEVEAKAIEKLADHLAISESPFASIGSVRNFAKQIREAK